MGGDFKGQNSLLSQGRILRIKGFGTKKAGWDGTGWDRTGRCFGRNSEEYAKAHMAFQARHSEALRSPPAGLL